MIAHGPLVTVLREKHVRGWPDHAHGDQAYVLPLSTALTRAYATDAHFTQYTTPNGRRLNTTAVGQVEIRLDVIALDFDCPAVHGTDAPVPERWRGDFNELYFALQEDHPGGYAYHTRGGARIVYAMTPTIIASTADAAKYSRDYSLIVSHLGRKYGLHADKACGDWTRLFRLPRATRTPGGNPEQWPTLGSATNIGKLWIADPTKADVARAKLAQPQIWNRGRRDTRTYSYSGSGQGLLFYALQARGAIKRERRHGFVIVCPNDAAHSCGKSGDTSTMMYPPSIGDSLGWIHCMHASCSGKTIKDWLAMFSESELESARRASGQVAS